MIWSNSKIPFAFIYACFYWRGRQELFALLEIVLEEVDNSFYYFTLGVCFERDNIRRYTCFTGTVNF